ncbi:MAG: divalent metal cation transporter [Candidatus Latescibacteria bacterium]|nr:divalent metal cation transporter [Candidatus Latescibacterota bacterium]
MPEKGECQTEIICGLPMFKASDPDVLEQERKRLVELEGKSLGARWKGYFSMTGPGWLQSGITLGGGSAIASLYLGAHYQYRLLWVQPLAMFVGVIMLMAASHQTLSTCIRPFDAMKRFIHPSIAWAWALATLLASIVFHLPQYALAAGVSEDMINLVTGWQPTGMTRNWLLIGIGCVIMLVSTGITWNYGRGLRGIRLYERMLKILVGMIILAFLIVVVRSATAGQIEWGKLFKGMLPLYVPTDTLGVTKIMAAFGASVGINQTFLFGYSQLARGWGKEHRGLAQFDLITGMMIPFTVATSLMVIAAGCTIYGSSFGPADINPANAGVLIGATGVGPVVGRFIFGFGLIGMTLSTITIQMLVTGFAACEIFGIEPSGWNYRLACIIPTPAFLGVILWTSMGTYIALPAFTFGLIMLPIAYVGWFLLQNSSRYLCEEKPVGKKALYWNIAMIFSLTVTFISVGYTLYKTLGPLLDAIKKAVLS